MKNSTTEQTETGISVFLIVSLDFCVVALGILMKNIVLILHFVHLFNLEMPTKQYKMNKQN